MCWGSQTALIISLYVAKQLQMSLLKHHLKDSLPGKSSPLPFGRDIFANFGNVKCHLAVSDEQMVWLEVLRR